MSAARRPKDLWFGVYRRQNATEFLGNPQLFAIASGRGVELGFYVSTHPSDFSNSELKARLRAAAPAIYRQLPDPGSPAAVELERSLGNQWDFRRKSRLEPGRHEFDDLSAWLRYFKSPAGAQEGGGGITRWFTGDELDAADLSAVVRDMTHRFQPLMSSIRAGSDERPPLLSPEPARVGRSFATLFGEMAEKFEVARQLPFREVPDLWELMEEIQTRLDTRTTAFISLIPPTAASFTISTKLRLKARRGGATAPGFLCHWHEAGRIAELSL